MTKFRTMRHEVPVLHRGLDVVFDRAGLDEKARTVKLTFSSEYPVERFFGIEILDHDRASVRMERFASGRAALLHFSLAFIQEAAAANRDHPRHYIGVGAFNLIRGDAYREIGGHTKLHLEVVDDMKLGMLLRRAGHRSRVFGASDNLEVAWAGTVGGLFRALEKNFFALLDFRTARALVLSLLPILLWAAAVIGPFTGSPAGIAAAAGLATLVLPCRVLSARSGWGWAPALLAPLLLPVLPLTACRSVLLTVWRGGIRWRDTFYPLAELRRGLVR